jgi:hypothetical protein
MAKPTDRLGRRARSSPVPIKLPLLGAVATDFSHHNRLEARVAELLVRYECAPTRDGWRDLALKLAFTHEEQGFIVEPNIQEHDRKPNDEQHRRDEMIDQHLIRMRLRAAERAGVQGVRQLRDCLHRIEETMASAPIDKPSLRLQTVRKGLQTQIAFFQSEGMSGIAGQPRGEQAVVNSDLVRTIDVLIDAATAAARLDLERTLLQVRNLRNHIAAAFWQISELRRQLEGLTGIAGRPNLPQVDHVVAAAKLVEKRLRKEWEDGGRPDGKAPPVAGTLEEQYSKRKARFVVGDESRPVPLNMIDRLQRTRLWELTQAAARNLEGDSCSTDDGEATSQVEPLEQL